MKPFEKFRARVGKPAAPATSFCSADEWVEHLEQEIEPKCMAEQKEQLDLVLKNSPEDLALRESLVRVRAAVKSLDDVAMPESGHYYDNLHSKIMAAIDDEIAMNGEPEPTTPSKKTERGFARGFFAAGRLRATTYGSMGLTMMIAILAFVGLHKQTGAPTAQTASVVEENFERKIAMVDSHSGATFAHEMGSFESEEDFLTESAAQRLKQLSRAQADALIRSLKR